VLVPLEKLRGQLEAARNWLSREYPAVVAELAAIVGPGALQGWYMPPGGTKYQRAAQLLQQAEAALEALGVLEANPPAPDDLAATGPWFTKATRLRLEIRDRIRSVFVKEEYEALPANLDDPVALRLADDD